MRESHSVKRTGILSKNSCLQQGKSGDGNQSDTSLGSVGRALVDGDLGRGLRGGGAVEHGVATLRGAHSQGGLLGALSGDLGGGGGGGEGHGDNLVTKGLGDDGGLDDGLGSLGGEGGLGDNTSGTVADVDKDAVLRGLGGLGLLLDADVVSAGDSDGGLLGGLGSGLDGADGGVDGLDTVDGLSDGGLLTGDLGLLALLVLARGDGGDGVVSVGHGDGLGDLGGDTLLLLVTRSDGGGGGVQHGLNEGGVGGGGSDGNQGSEGERSHC